MHLMTYNICFHDFLQRVLESAVMTQKLLLNFKMPIVKDIQRKTQLQLL